MVPIVFLINGFTKGDWLDAFIFGLSVAVGLTPEMLPTIVTACLSKGAVFMAKKKVIVKNLNSIQNLGAIDVLCTDKTGTLTEDRVVLEYHLNVNGKEDVRVLRHAFFNSYFQTGLKNLMDVAIISKTKEVFLKDDTYQTLINNYQKVDEIPFDFERRRMSVVVQDQNGKTQMITKGAIEEMLKISTKVEIQNQIYDLNEEMKKFVLARVNRLNEEGMRVLGVAQKTNPSPIDTFSVKDESEMVLIGFLAFLDPPKKSTAKAIENLKKYGVSIKVLTGDNEKVTKYIAKKVGLSVDNILLGNDIENMSEEELKVEVEKTTIFAKLSPNQKARIISCLRSNGHTVGYMGDGINDANAMKASDVAISVDTAVDIAKEEANIILLEKDLNVLKDGIIEGRRTYANMIKYIKMTASSNFGNMFSFLVASAWLPFLPMLPLQLIALNLIYDLSCITITWDNVDEEFLLKPKKWEAKSITKFMLWIGPTSSIFDIVTYLVMFYVVCPNVFGADYYTLAASNPAAAAGFVTLFQTGWFVESMWTQTLVIHMIRSQKIPFIQSRASWQLTCATFAGIGLLTSLPFIPYLNSIFGLTALPAIYFGYLALIVLSYIILVTCVKFIYIKKYHQFL